MPITSPATQTNNTSNSNNIDVVKMEVFCQKTNDMEMIPPTAKAVLQNLTRSSYQASIWNAAHISEMSVTNPELHEWMVGRETCPDLGNDTPGERRVQH